MPQNQAILAPQTQSFTSFTRNAMGRTRTPLSSSGGMSSGDLQRSQESSQQHVEGMQRQRLDESSRRFDQRQQMLQHNQDRMYKEYQRGQAALEAYQNKALELPLKSYHQRDVWKAQHAMQIAVSERNHANLGAVSAMIQALGNGKTPEDVAKWDSQRLERTKQFADAKNAISSGIVGTEEVQKLGDEAYGNFVLANFNARISQELEDWSTGPGGSTPSLDPANAALQIQALRQVQSDLIARTHGRVGTAKKGLLDKGWLAELDEQDNDPGENTNRSMFQGRSALLREPTIIYKDEEGIEQTGSRRPIRTRQVLSAFATDDTIQVTPADRVAYKALLDEYDAWAIQNGKIPAGNPKVTALLGRISGILKATDQKMGVARITFFNAMRGGRGGAKSLSDEIRWMNATYHHMNQPTYNGFLAREYGDLPPNATDEMKTWVMQSGLQKLVSSLQRIQSPGQLQPAPTFP